MRILITNDDGVHSPGLLAVRDRLVAIADSVITIAPETDCSGLAQACTFSRPVSVTRLSGGDHAVFSCDGTPTDCVRVGLLGGLAARTDLVVCGINHGANLADDVAYSGTIGAGREAAILGTSALCLSQQTPTGSFAVNYREDLEQLGLRYDFEVAASYAADLARAMCQGPASEPVVLNVNFPANVASTEGVLTRVGRRAYPRSGSPAWAEGEKTRSYYLFGRPDEEFAEEGDASGTDIAALRAGRISVMAVPVSWQPDHLTGQEHEYLDGLSARLRPPHSLLVV
ncbi:MAG TPA: 5'/3'-nucleotidase SurE [Acidimicrobiales bacterium]|nr:5'/3'-nucleotidase SurE [Acidimicrobiales bacterium]